MLKNVFIPIHKDIFLSPNTNKEMQHHCFICIFSYLCLINGLQRPRIEK